MPTRFYFRADDQISLKKLQAIKERDGYDVLIGVDPGLDDTPSDVAQELIDNVKKVGLLLHFYLVGPGMMSWSDDEAEQIRSFAESVGIDTSEKSWHDEWTDWGWKDKVLEQFEYYYTTYGAYSCEIDNLDAALGDDPEARIEYVKELQKALYERGVETKLMLKNLDEEMLDMLVIEIEAKTIDKDFLCEWGMFEEGTGDPERQADLCEKMGIMAITPETGITDTHHYGVDNDGIPSLLNRVA